MNRHQQYLRQRYRAILGYAGSLIGFVGLLHLAPLILALFKPAEAPFAPAFVVVGVPLTLIGYGAFRWLNPREDVHLTLAEAMAVVVLVWLAALIASAIPFALILNLTLPQAIFESTSGWTGTGLSVILPESVPDMILFHRSFTQLWGGAGFAIIALSAIASPLGAGFSAAEGRTDQLAPHVRRSAIIVLSIYMGYIVFGVLALRIAGMNWFEAVNHAFTGIATGGFSTRNGSIGAFDSPTIELVMMVLMVLGSINFFLAYTALRGKWRALLRSAELRIMVPILVVSMVLLAIFVTLPLYSPERGLRIAVFEVTAALTSTGFAPADYRQWNDFGLAILAVLMCIGGGVGSTSGGIKLLRVYILAQVVIWEIRKAFLPQHIVNKPSIWQGERRITLSDQQVTTLLPFLVLFIVVFLMGCGVLMAYGYNLHDSVFEIASAIGNTGLSVGIVQPTMPEPLLWYLSVVMLLGRLEFLAVIIGVFKLLGDGKSLLTAAGRTAHH